MQRVFDRPEPEVVRPEAAALLPRLAATVRVAALTNDLADFHSDPLSLGRA